MAYEITYDDGRGGIKRDVCLHIDDAATLAWAWAYESLGNNALRDRQIAWDAREGIYQFEVAAKSNRVGYYRRVRTGPDGQYVEIKRVW